MKFPYAGAQFNLALTEDSCLIAIPGSHNRLRTQEEREKTVDATKRKKYITGQTVVDLHPGDIVFTIIIFCIVLNTLASKRD